MGQVALRYLIDSGVAVIPKSVKPERMAGNIDVFDFGLAAEDKEAIAGLDTDHSICYDHTDLTVVAGLLGFIKSAMQSRACNTMKVGRGISLILPRVSTWPDRSHAEMGHSDQEEPT